MGRTLKAREKEVVIQEPQKESEDGKRHWVEWKEMEKADGIRTNMLTI